MIASVQVDEDTITINGKKIDISVLMAIIEPDKRILYAFIHKDGVTQAIPYTERQVIWMDRGDQF